MPRRLAARAAARWMAQQRDEDLNHADAFEQQESLAHMLSAHAQQMELLQEFYETTLKALQEAMQRIEELETRLARLEGSSAN